MKTLWYVYKQNNSGGDFYGPIVVAVEATGPAEADERAAVVGIYFDGVEEGIDCDCCGDRWYRAASFNAYDTLAEAMDTYAWHPDSARAVVYADGTVRKWAGSAAA